MRLICVIAVVVCLSAVGCAVSPDPPEEKTPIQYNVPTQTESVANKFMEHVQNDDFASAFRLLSSSEREFYGTVKNFKDDWLQYTRNSNITYSSPGISQSEHTYNWCYPVSFANGRCMILFSVQDNTIMHFMFKRDFAEAEKVFAALINKDYVSVKDMEYPLEQAPDDALPIEDVLLITGEYSSCDPPYTYDSFDGVTYYFPAQFSNGDFIVCISFSFFTNNQYCISLIEK